MVYRDKYAVYIEWGYRPDTSEPFERCCIYHPDDDALSYDGYNMVGEHGNAGFDFNIYDTLEDAMVNSGFNPNHIDFQDIDKKDITDVLSHYMWLANEGYVKVPTK